MNRQLRMSVLSCLSATVVLILPTYASAQKMCSKKDLNGAFAFSITGTNFQFSVQFATVGRFLSDGMGNISGAATESVNGGISRVTFTGTYSVSSDCTGSAGLVFGNGGTANLDFVIANNDRDIFIIDSDAGTLETGTAKKQLTEVAGRQGPG